MAAVSVISNDGAPTAAPRRGEQAHQSLGARGPRRRRHGRRDALTAAAFLAPALLLIVVVRIVPVIGAVNDATHRGLPGGFQAPAFVGLDNFRTLFSSPGFWESMQNTLVFNLVINPLQVVLALALAMLLQQNLPGRGLWRTLVFLPCAIPLTGSTIIFGIALRPHGPVNGGLELFGLPAQPWFTSPDQVLFAIIILASWVGIGYWMIFLIAGLNDIPGELYESARMDGAGTWRTFVHITLPMLRRPLLFVLVADTVANFTLFAPIQVLTGGGPEGRSNLLMYDVYRRGFELSDPYTSSAELLVLLTLMVTIVIIQFRLLGGGPEGD